MIDLLKLLGGLLVGLFGSHAARQAEMAFLRQRPNVELKVQTVDEVVSATGWQRHTVRGVFSGTLKKKLGLTLALAKEASPQRRFYTVVGPRQSAEERSPRQPAGAVRRISHSHGLRYSRRTRLSALRSDWELAAAERAYLRAGRCQPRAPRHASDFCNLVNGGVQLGTVGA
jgi:hypothetical protein